jgi:hypothetical protein
MHKLKIVLSSIHPSIQECEGAAYHSTAISQLPSSHYWLIKAQSLQKQLGLPIPVSNKMMTKSASNLFKTT